MINRLLCSVLAATCWPALFFAQSVSIAVARAQPPGTVVSVRGVVTNGPELGKIRFLQDGTGGIAAYPGSGSAAGFEQNVGRGDSVQVSGALTLFQGLLEITPITDYQVISSGNPLPAPKPVALAGLSDALEGQLVRVSCAQFDDAGGIFSGSGTYDLTDSGGGSAHVYLGSDSPLLGDDVPTGPAQLTAVLSRYGDFQLLPRDFSDFAAASCLYFAEQPHQSNIDTNSFVVRWKTNIPATATVHYGPSPDLGTEIALPGPSAEYILSIGDLDPGTIYWVQISATQNGETVLSERVPFATRSLSSGQIKVLFNHPVEASFVGALPPAGQSFEECRAEIIARIDAAQQTLDAAIYNNNRDDLTAALEQAQARGVRVRYIASDDTQNAALDPPPSFPVVFGNSLALMHQKFMVIDADLSDRAWVMSGSMNWTTGNMTNDYNNLLFIQDQSLARAYELEFEEMWGSDGALPDLANGRFGVAKKDNTPHRFVVGGVPVECYFSPSDGVTGRIVETIGQSDVTADFALFSFTKNEPGDALVEAFATGIAVRGMIENISDLGCEYDHLAFNGVPVQAHSSSGDLHHKYVVTDAFSPDLDPTVLTGSHNWSQNAESANDENTLVIHDADIARLFAAEFERRWEENTTHTGEARPDAAVEIWPNPTGNVLNIKYSEHADSPERVVIFDLLGRALLQSEQADRLDVNALQPGMYWLKIQSRQGANAVFFQKI